MKKDSVQGVVKRHPDGFGFLIPDDPEMPDLFLSRKEMRGVMTNDRVQAQMKKESRGDRFYGESVRVVERGVKRVVGKVKSNGDGDLSLYGGFQKWGVPLKIPYKSARGAMEGDLVAVQIVQYPDDAQEFVGRVVEIIGDEEDPNNDIKRVLHLQNIPMEFSFPAIHEAKSVSQKVSNKDIEGREDLRELCFITIDGVTAKDFDDAIYVERDDQGFKLWVAIADVSHYVRPDSQLDDQAIERGTSVYLPNFVTPMLPEELSNGICSLKPNEDRLAMVCEMRLGFDGVVTHKKVYEAVICSQARVTYGEAQDIINKESSHDKESVNKNISLAADLAKILMAKRYREGSLDLEVPETEIVVNDLGEPTDIIKAERVFAHKLIEEMMLVANVSVAELIIDKEQPGLFRVHEPPKAEDIDRIQLFLHNFGSEKKLRGGHLQKKLSKSLQDFRGKPEGIVLNILTLRSMSQAQYSSNNIGHFGLGFQKYTHFTSPIRRYPDLMVHRVLKKLFTSSPSGHLYSEDELTTAGSMMSAYEQRAVKAERMVKSIKKARFLENKVGEKFSGIISSVARFGVFVLLRQYDVDGLVKIENLGNDRFEFDEDNLILVGARSKKIYRIGDLVEVVVSGVNVEEGQIDFVLAEMGDLSVQRDAKPRKKKSSPPRGKNKKSKKPKKKSKKDKGKKRRR